MSLSFHPLVQKDINSILRRYDNISRKLGDQFFAELTKAFDSVLNNPQRGHISGGCPKAQLTSFTFYFLYRLLPGRIRVIIVKHHTGGVQS
jgi:hypothetical protein